MIQQIHLSIHGSVTRVGFRAWASLQARKLGITGWTRNVYNNPGLYGPHGGVEIVAQGEEQRLKDFVDILESGSSLSRVDGVHITLQECVENFPDFVVKKSEAYLHHS